MRKQKLEELKQYIEELKTIKFNRTSGTFLKSEGYNCTLNNGVIIKREKLIKGSNDGSAVIIMPVTNNNEILTVIEPLKKQLVLACLLDMLKKANNLKIQL